MTLILGGAENHHLGHYYFDHTSRFPILHLHQLDGSIPL